MKKKNKIAMILALMTGAIFASADYVTLIDTDAAGGIRVVEKSITENDIKDIIAQTKEEMMPVGTITMRMDNINPSSIYGGTWSLLSGDAVLSFGDGTTQSGVAIGENNPNVPLVEHSHSINHNHAKVNTDSKGNHRHAIRSESPEPSGDGALGDTFDEGNTLLKSMYTEYTGNHTHSVDLPNFAGSSGKAGVASPTIDVRGKRINVNVWQRTL